ncbi:hypothetical protein C7974DRAFT_377668 [Boeremia exigua]|uniref:uncharacterized protein n=1 Tax=Boeremia exigua TaxID=749465 RepID=UPI001E8D446E|nr:uncharacterized protein C7974DRAFT_377668 [Boeremia exigua]KAH6622044.1 hypothetical protein C7974DRAFT_377668 [Boeremia exigua]
MNWITHLCAALWAVTNDYAWFAVDPTASFALAQANCTLPSPQCLRQAKAVHHQLTKEHVDLYWWSVTEETAKIEHERQTKEAHDRYIVGQLAKADKWDRWEMSPPTIIQQTVTNIINPTYNTFVNPTIVSPTLVSIFTAPPEVPGLEAKALSAKRSPSIESGVTTIDNSFERAEGHTLAKQIIGLVFLGTVIYMVVCFVSALVRYLYMWVCSSSAPSSPAPSSPAPSSPGPTPQAPERPLESPKGTLLSSELPFAPASPCQEDTEWDDFAIDLGEQLSDAFAKDMALESLLKSPLGTTSEQSPSVLVAAASAEAEVEKIPSKEVEQAPSAEVEEARPARKTTVARFVCSFSPNTSPALPSSSIWCEKLAPRPAAETIARQDPGSSGVIVSLPSSSATISPPQATDRQVSASLHAS